MRSIFEQTAAEAAGPSGAMGPGRDDAGAAGATERSGEAVRRGAVQLTTDDGARRATAIYRWEYNWGVIGGFTP